MDNNKYILQLEKNTVWEVCKICSSSEYWGSGYSDIDYLLFISPSRIYEMSNFFTLNENKFKHSLLEDDDDIYTIIAHCYERCSKSLIIHCSEDVIELPLYFKHNTVKEFFLSGLDEAFPFGFPGLDKFYNGKRAYQMLDIDYDNTMLLQMFEPFWEELEIAWIP